MYSLRPTASIRPSSLPHATVAQPQAGSQVDKRHTQRPITEVRKLQAYLDPLTRLTNGLRKGVADEQLAKREEQRLLERERDGMTATPPRSPSVASVTSSVSTISTNMSRSPPPRSRGGRSKDAASHGSRPASVVDRMQSTKKRHRRSRSSSASYSSASSYGGNRRSLTPERNTRRRRSSFSPDERGRRRSTSRRRPTHSHTRSPSYDRRRKAARRRRSSSRDETTGDANGYRARAHPSKRDRSADSSPRRQRRRGSRHDDDRYGGRVVSRDDAGRQGEDDRHNHDRERERGAPPPASPPPAGVRKERSLSPFSKRLALTQAMNMGR